MSAPTDFAANLRVMVEALRAQPGVRVKVAEINPPCDEDEIARVNEVVGEPLDALVLDYYRSANGARVAWESDITSGGFDLRPLGEVFLNTNQPVFASALDGADERFIFECTYNELEIRSRLRCFDKARVLHDYPTAAVFVYPDMDGPWPNVLFPSKYCACLDDSHPMSLVSYLEMMVATCGHESAAYDFANRGYGGFHMHIRWSHEEWATLGGPAKYLAWLHSRGDVLANYAPAMSKLEDTLRSGVTPRDLDPKRWVELRYGVTYPS